MCNGFRHCHSDSFLNGGQALRIFDQYTYLEVVLHKTGCFKAAISSIEKLAAARKRTLFAMQYCCPESGVWMTHIFAVLCFISGTASPFIQLPGVVSRQPVRSSLFLQMKTVHNHFMKRTLHMHKFKLVSDGAVLCELGRVCSYIGKNATEVCWQAQWVTLWQTGQEGFHSCFIGKHSLVSLWLSPHGFDGVLAEGTVSLAIAE